MKALGVLLAVLAAAAPVGPRPVQAANDYLAGQQQADGGFAEPGGVSDPTLTAWTVLGLKAGGRNPASLSRAGASTAQYLAGRPVRTTGELALRILALDALGQDTGELVDRLTNHRAAGGRIGPLVNSTIWSVIALRAADRTVPQATVRYLLRQQHRGGGWSWSPRGAPDSNDTAAAIQALRAVGVRGAPIRRGIAFLRRLQNRDGGFALTPGATSDAQSTAWAAQAFVAAGVPVPPNATRYLLALRGPRGFFRYSSRRAITPVWVTASVVPALARRAFPLR